MTKRAVTAIIDARALREIDEARAWWAEHRRTPDLDDAIAAALDRLEQFPEISPRVKRGSRWTTTRRYILDRVGYHLYYRFDERTGTLFVRSLWHERRSKPRL